MIFPQSRKASLLSAGSQQRALLRRWVTLLLMSATPTAPILAQTPSQARVTATSANLRQGPNTTEPILGQVNQGVILEVTDKTGSWYRVRLSAEFGLPSQLGYIHSSTVEIIQPSATFRSSTSESEVLAPRASRSAASRGEPRDGYKEPGTAMLIGVAIPGGGHFYTGETKRGLTLLGIGLGGMFVGTAMTAGSISASCSGFSCQDDTNYLPMAVGYLAFFGSWIYGILDADDSARRMNARRGLSSATIHAEPVIQPGESGAVDMGLKLRF